MTPEEAVLELAYCLRKGTAWLDPNGEGFCINAANPPDLQEEFEELVRLQALVPGERKRELLGLRVNND